MSPFRARANINSPGVTSLIGRFWTNAKSDQTAEGCKLKLNNLCVRCTLFHLDRPRSSAAARSQSWVSPLWALYPNGRIRLLYNSNSSPPHLHSNTRASRGRDAPWVGRVDHCWPQLAPLAPGVGTRGGFALKCARNTPFFEKGFILLSELLRKVSLVIRASL